MLLKSIKALLKPLKREPKIKERTEYKNINKKGNKTGYTIVSLRKNNLKIKSKIKTQKDNNLGVIGVSNTINKSV